MSTATESDSHRRPAKPPALNEIAGAFPDLEVLGFLGAGGMGCVYRVRERETGRVSALKILPREFASDPAFVERFQREARTLARLHHPNIVGIHAFGHRGGFCHLLMEHVDGANLRQTLRSGRFTPAQALALIPPLCDALQYAHSQGVLHRDIKPENILLDAEGRVKIADFGIAKIVGGTESVLDDATLTRTGARLGTPHYMAPEQVEKPEQVDHRADIYSLGVVFYELLTGELPLGRFQVPSAKATLDARVDEIVLRALAKERELRQQTAEQVKTEVEGLAGARLDWKWPFRRMHYWVPAVLLAAALVIFRGIPGVPEIVLVASVLVIGLGVREIRCQRPRLRQYFAAMTGVISLVLLVAAASWGILRLQQKSRRIELMNNLGKIGAVLRTSARNTPEGTIYPASTNLAELGDWSVWNQWLVDPITGGRIEYVGAGWTNPRPQTVLLASPLGPSGRFVYLADGSVQPMSEREFQARLRADHQSLAVAQTNSRLAGLLPGVFHMVRPFRKDEIQGHFETEGNALGSHPMGFENATLALGGGLSSLPTNDFQAANQTLGILRFLLITQKDADFEFSIPRDADETGPRYLHRRTASQHGGLLALSAIIAARAGDRSGLTEIQEAGRHLWDGLDKLLICERSLDGDQQHREEIWISTQDVLNLRPGISKSMTVIRFSTIRGELPQTNVVMNPWQRIP